ncbi:hypothetical protein B0H19DRAFT_1077121 [Mycena capillaripes]|nr:hypothetical protein B0H19DRAFT_1077121 [Mycena capillaripes]
MAKLLKRGNYVMTRRGREGRRDEEVVSIIGRQRQSIRYKRGIRSWRSSAGGKPKDERGGIRQYARQTERWVGRSVGAGVSIQWHLRRWLAQNRKGEGGIIVEDVVWQEERAEARRCIMQEEEMRSCDDAVCARVGAAGTVEPGTDGGSRVFTTAKV